MYYTYFMFRKKYNVPGTGTHYSYDIVAYGPLYLGPVQVVQDVSPDAHLVARMVKAFNRIQIPPDQLEAAIRDFFDQDSLSLK